MKNIKIYQIENIGECKYSFMDWDYASDKVDMKDYKMVVEFSKEYEGNDDDIMNEIWKIGNDGTLQKIFRMRSVSMSDIIEIDGRKYYVDTFGFKEV